MNHLQAIELKSPMRYVLGELATADRDEFQALADEYARENEELRARAGLAELARDHWRNEFERAQVARRGYFRYAYVRCLLDSVDRREFVAVKQLLSLVILELWHMVFVDRAPSAADVSTCAVAS